MCVPRVLAPDEGESMWEGNTMHLPAASRVLIDIMRHVRHFSVSFDYMAEEVIAKTGDPGMTSVVERFAAMGAPWHYGISDVRSLADKAVATILENVKVANLHRAPWPNKQLDSPIYVRYSLCTLQAVEQ